ncbi:MAG: hypothetical protein V1692_00280, partial [bacterium]
MAVQQENQTENKTNPFKTAQNIMDIIKLASAIGSCAGDIFISGIIFILSAHGEWLISIFIAEYKIPWWKKALVVIVDFILAIIVLNFFLFLGIAVNCDIRKMAVGAITDKATHSSILGWLTAQLSGLV